MAIQTGIFSEEQQEKWSRAEQLRAILDEAIDKGEEMPAAERAEYFKMMPSGVGLSLLHRAAGRREEMAVEALVKEAHDPNIGGMLQHRLLAAILLKLHGKSLT